MIPIERSAAPPTFPTRTDSGDPSPAPSSSFDVSEGAISSKMPTTSSLTAVTASSDFVFENIIDLGELTSL
jgi:hypothetical protein